MPKEFAYVSRSLRQRTFFVLLFFIGAVMVVLFRLCLLQVFAADTLKAKGEDQQCREIPVAAQRGDILDCSGSPLALSVTVPSVYASPTEISPEEAPEIAAALQKLLGVDSETVLKKLTQRRSFEWISRKIDEETADKVRAAGLKGIGLTSETKRVYPNGILACHILGFAGIDNQGLEGIEATREDVLQGESGFVLARYDSHGKAIAGTEKTYVEPRNGDGIMLTIDENIQFFCERELDKVMNGSVDPKGAVAIVMKPATGEILALAQRPAYDPNHYGDYDSSLWRNTALCDYYEPGSTAKILTISAALEENVVSENDTFYDRGYAKVGKVKIRCWSSNPHGSETFVEVAENSCNPAFVEVGQRLDQSDKLTFYRYLKSFGIGSLTGLPLFGESAGSLRNYPTAADVNAVDIANMYIGQGYGVTPIQLITAVSAAVNGGKLMEPHLIKAILDEKGNLKEEIKPRCVRQVISAETSKRVCKILESVVQNGTGNKAYLEGYRVGGKTGTAQKFIDGAYSKSKYVASFIGIAPMNDPEVVCLVVIDEPGSYPVYGGTIAAPVCKEILNDTLRYLGVKPQTTVAEPPAATVTVPLLAGLDTEEAVALLKEMGLKPQTKGSGKKVIAQTPAVLTVVETDTTVLLTLGNTADYAVTLPDLTGMTLQTADETLKALGLVMTPEGNGVVTEQKPKAGTAVKRGEAVWVRFEEDSPVGTAMP